MFGQQIIDDYIHYFLKICLDSSRPYIFFCFLRRTLCRIRILGYGFFGREAREKNQPLDLQSRNPHW